MSASQQLFGYLQSILPQHLCSRLAGRLANSEIVWFKNFLINRFIRTYAIDIQEALLTDPNAYKSFNAFFTRHLKPDARRLRCGKTNLLAPVDGTLSQYGKITDGQLIQAKSHRFTLSDLLGGDEHMAQPFLSGHYMTFYLAPRDYHRIHMPYSGKLLRMRHIPGKLFSVNPSTAATIPQLFARNERVVTLFETEMGPIALVLVGAMLVASIQTKWAGIITPAKTKALTIRDWHYPQHSGEIVFLSQGEEMGCFQFGSTVIMLCAASDFSWPTSIREGQATRLGEIMGLFSSSDD